MVRGKTSARSAKKPGENPGSSGSSTGQKKKKNISNSKDVAHLPETEDDNLRRLRACMICSLIKSESQFEEEGCDNCETFLQLAGTKGAIDSYTSARFDGMIGMAQPTSSWVAKWQRIAQLKAGIYAISVSGELNNWVQDELKDAGLPYYCRNTSKPQ